MPNKFAATVLKHSGSHVHYACLFDDMIILSIHLRVSANMSFDAYNEQLDIISACLNNWPTVPVFIGGDFNTGLGVVVEGATGPWVGDASGFLQPCLLSA